MISITLLLCEAAMAVFLVGISIHDIRQHIIKNEVVKIYNAAGDQLIEYYELQYLKIFGITNNDGTQIEEVAGDASRMAATYTFAVTYEQAEKLIALDHNGELHFVLVSRGDVERAEKLMQKQTDLLNKINERNFNQNTFDYDEWSAKWEASNG